MKRYNDATGQMTRTARIKNIAAVFIMILSAAAFLIAGAVSRTGKTSAGRVRILVDGKIYSEQPLRAGEHIKVSRPDGCENVVMMTDNGFYMQSASCRNQECVHQGTVTEDNYMFRVLGTSIICIPNRVEVQLILSDDPDKPVMDIPDV